MIDNLAWYLAAGRTAHPIADWALDQVLTYGPGIALFGALYGLYCTSTAVRARRAARRQLLAEMQRAARLAQQPPHIPTQPGTDDNLLAACWNAWNTDTTRKEKP